MVIVQVDFRNGRLPQRALRHMRSTSAQWCGQLETRSVSQGPPLDRHRLQDSLCDCVVETAESLRSMRKADESLQIDWSLFGAHAIDTHASQGVLVMRTSAARSYGSCSSRLVYCNILRDELVGPDWQRTVPAVATSRACL
jgi:hypothetical protein